MSVFFKVRCPSCQRERSEEFNYTDQEFRIRWDRWSQGAHVHDAFPELSVRQREAMQTGICDSCWKKIFPDAKER
jgi:hypothetical protein